MAGFSSLLTARMHNILSDSHRARWVGEGGRSLRAGARPPAMRFKNDEGGAKNEKHQCGYCKERAYLFCKTCFPDGEKDMETIDYAICNPNTERGCFAKHVCGVAPSHFMRKIVKEATRASPRLAARQRPRSATEAARGERSAVRQPRI